MNRTNTLPNGIMTVYAFEEIPEVDNPLIMFLAGTTSWNSDLVTESWRREFLKQIGQETGLRNNIVICVPEPRYGRFTERSSRHLIDWETEHLDLAHIHAYWLNTYWTFDQAIAGTTEQSYLYYSDGDRANIGITVRHELGASFARVKYGNGFELIVGAPEDAQSLDWVKVYSRLQGIPVYFSHDKTKAFSDDFYERIICELQA